MNNYEEGAREVDLLITKTALTIEELLAGGHYEKVPELITALSDLIESNVHMKITSLPVIHGGEIAGILKGEKDGDDIC